MSYQQMQSAKSEKQCLTFEMILKWVFILAILGIAIATLVLVIKTKDDVYVVHDAVIATCGPLVKK